MFAPRFRLLEDDSQLSLVTTEQNLSSCLTDYLMAQPRRGFAFYEQNFTSTGVYYIEEREGKRKLCEELLTPVKHTDCLWSRILIFSLRALLALALIRSNAKKSPPSHSCKL